ncbi:MAG TPA: chromosome segregation protein SMC [Burkholderiales bacterium]|nr:chromosome segregation protein SMC [Burkholderiales bacterium]
MRLTQIKLAGFKSFVDPTTVNIPGKLVGVVGPNGCGKSNIIDAVRWVLGESRAAALRGDSMQDVIFNGSSLRKPMARASVELMFDNSLGKAAGQWSQYAEISVKRVLQRDGESSYFINNTHVRRRDVQDIFLGTGLGPRAYAIVEQGMISRIIEAKPEELRVFLEEAAGVSKYKERRRETEHRLADTRENLARVGDIRQELGAQIEKLDKQAGVARRYNELSAERAHKQNLLWLLRRDDAEAEARRHAREIERNATELEGETARLREIERELAQARADHYAAGDALNAAQGELYGANSESSRLETEIRFVAETRQRLEAQKVQLLARRDSGRQQEAELRDAAREWQERLSQSREGLAQARHMLAEGQAKLPQAEQALRLLQGRIAGEHERIAQAEQAFQVGQAHLAHAGKTLQALEGREEPLLAERKELVAPDSQLLARLAQELAQSNAELSRQETLAAQVETARAAIVVQREAATEKVRTLEREISALDGRLLTLQKIQNQVEENGQIQEWIARHGLASMPRLWSKIRVESGWEVAVESALRERLHALEMSDPELLQRLIEDPPPAKVSAFTPGEGAEPARERGLKSLADYLTVLEPGVHGVIAAWLAPYYAVEGVPRLMTRMGLSPQAVLVTREGHQFSRYGVSFHAPDPADTGILARQREIEALSAEALERQEEIEGARQTLSKLERSLAEHDEGLAQLRAAGTALKQRHHERQLEHLRLTQGQERYEERRRQIERELGEIAAQKAQEQANQTGAETRLEQRQHEIDELYRRLELTQQEHDAAERNLEAQREEAQQAERTLQEAGFYEKECLNKLNEIDRSINTLLEQVQGTGENMERLQAELSDAGDQILRDQLQRALQTRLARERALAAARNRQEEVANRLRSAEETRLACEQKLQPLRDRIAEMRLKEQAARINYDQFAQQLRDAGADDAALAGAMREGQKAAPLQAEITRLTNAIAELGAINMAALDELTASQERKQFLDAQAADLVAALETLENAIRKIDRETRELLQSTFDAVNRHFDELFPALFGGGEAKLIMTGEEILDCGVQVMARPPGKKNTTIHLLSGGEKALTAIALVFSFFQLNPAPFCLLDEVDAPLDDANVERFCDLVKKMSRQTQFLFISHNKITMEMGQQLVGVTMQEQGVSRVVAVDIEEALKLSDEPLAVEVNS